MTGQERYVGQLQDSGVVLRGQSEQRSAEHGLAQQPDEAGVNRLLAQSVGNRAMGEMLAGHDAGAPLKPGLREEMERSLGTKLDSVRVHDDDAAHASAAALDADAYSVGEQIVLGRNAPSIQDTAGQDLLAHELVHVVQQRNAAVIQPIVSNSDDASEHEAHALSRQARSGQSVHVGLGSSIAGAQRQPAATVTKRVEPAAASREEVRQVILVFLQKVQTAQDGTSIKITDTVKGALRMLASAESPGQGKQGDPAKAQRIVSMENLLGAASIDAGDLASRAAQILPDPFDRATLEKLQSMSGTEPQKSTIGRVADLARKEFAKPQTPSDPVPSTEKRLEQQMDNLRAARGAPPPKTVGPVSVDLFALGRFVQNLPGTVKPKAQTHKTQPRDYPEVDQAIQKIPNDSLIPSEVRGKEEAGNFADAREVAAYLARDMDVAQQEQRESVELRLPEGYNQVKDREAMVNAMLSIVQMVRQVLPHHASAVKYVDIYFGKHLVTRSVAPSQ
jgi:hypothetical protein